MNVGCESLQNPGVLPIPPPRLSREPLRGESPFPYVTAGVGRGLPPWAQRGCLSRSLRLHRRFRDTLPRYTTGSLGSGSGRLDRPRRQPTRPPPEESGSRVTGKTRWTRPGLQETPVTLLLGVT